MDLLISIYKKWSKVPQRALKCVSAVRLHQWDNVFPLNIFLRGLLNRGMKIGRIRSIFAISENQGSNNCKDDQRLLVLCHRTCTTVSSETINICFSLKTIRRDSIIKGLRLYSRAKLTLMPVILSVSRSLQLLIRPSSGLQLYGNRYSVDYQSYSFYRLFLGLSRGLQSVSRFTVLRLGVYSHAFRGLQSCFGY